MMVVLMSGQDAKVSRSLIRQFLAGLRFPQLFTLAAVLFIVDLFIPDLIPFMDEIMLGIVAIVLGSWEKKRERPGPKPPMKDVTPKD
jgi:hypothetical protein